MLAMKAQETSETLSEKSELEKFILQKITDTSDLCVKGLVWKRRTMISSVFKCSNSVSG